MTHESHARRHAVKQGGKEIKKRAKVDGKEVGLENWWPLYPLFRQGTQDKTPTSKEAKTFSKPSSEAINARSIEQIPELQVSDKTLEIMAAQKHPWLLADSKTGSRDRLQPGQLVKLVAEKSSSKPKKSSLKVAKGRVGGLSIPHSTVYAVIDSTTDELAARFWATDDEAAEDLIEEALLRLDEAICRRTDLMSDPGNTLYRLVHGEADGLPGLYIDRCGSILRATIYGGAAFAFKEAVYDELEASEPGVMILEIDHRTDVRQADTLPEATVVRGAVYCKQGDRVVGCEDGLQYYLEPWTGIDVGFFADQRFNRRYLERYVEGQKRPGRWLNLFCHTGAFTVKLLSLGASCVNVDLSERYLDWLSDNLELNGLDVSRSASFAEDARKYVARAVESLDDFEGFDGIVIDPPTAAAGDGSFWSIRKDYQALIADCFSLLRTDGESVMLVCRNDRKGRGGLQELISSAADDAQVSDIVFRDALVADDYPELEGFPEGTPFEGVFVHVNSNGNKGL